MQRNQHAVSTRLIFAFLLVKQGKKFSEHLIQQDRVLHRAVDLAVTSPYDLQQDNIRFLFRAGIRPVRYASREQGGISGALISNVMINSNRSETPDSSSSVTNRAS